MKESFEDIIQQASVQIENKDDNLIGSMFDSFLGRPSYDHIGNKVKDPPPFDSNQFKSTLYLYLVEGYSDYIRSIRLWAYLRMFIAGLCLAVIAYSRWGDRFSLSYGYVVFAVGLLTSYGFLEERIIQKKKELVKNGIASVARMQEAQSPPRVP